MKYENFKEVEEIVKKIDSRENLLKELDLLLKYQGSYQNVKFSARVEVSHTSGVIPERYSHLTANFLNAVIDEVKKEIKVCHEDLSTL